MDTKHYYVYKWTNKETRKSYIGYTSLSVLKRWQKHLTNALSGNDTHFYRSIRKYGAASFECEVLGEYLSKNQALHMEKYFIIMLNTISPHGYNGTTGGTGGNTYSSCPEKHAQHILKLRLASAGQNNPNYSGMSDDEILGHAACLYHELGYWCAHEWERKSKRFNIPLHFVKYRFSKYGGGSRGFRLALSEKLNVSLAHLRSKRTPEQSARIATALRGRIWVTDLSLNKSYLAHENELAKPNIIKGRKC